MSAFVYKHFAEDGTLLYIGCTTNFSGRMSSHSFSAGWWDEVAKIEAIRYRNKRDALRGEAGLIRLLKPKFNAIDLTRPVKIEVYLTTVMHKKMKDEIAIQKRQRVHINASDIVGEALGERFSKSNRKKA